MEEPHISTTRQLTLPPVVVAYDVLREASNRLQGHLLALEAIDRRSTPVSASWRRVRPLRTVHVRPHAEASAVNVFEHVKLAESARDATSPVQANLNVTPNFAAAPLVDEPHR